MSNIADTNRVSLQRKITLVNGVAIIVGSMIGSGIFVSPTGVYLQVKSVGLSLLIWLMSGVFSMMGALCYSELGTCIAKSGGEYAYLKAAFGPLPAFLQLWVSLMVITPTSLAIISLTFAQYAIKHFYQDCPSDPVVIRMLAACCLLRRCPTRLDDDKDGRRHRRRETYLRN